MLAIFNQDMGQRLYDLEKYLGLGNPIGVRFLEAYQHSNTSQPDRIRVDIIGSPRTLVFGVDMAKCVADQLEANGRIGAAQMIREVLPG